jgi:predicted aldo/keto reductase-like oxidoreductase
MRLPVMDDVPGIIDEPEAARKIRYAGDHRVNYAHTAHPYHQQTNEDSLGRTLQGGYREPIKVATKMPS